METLSNIATSIGFWSGYILWAVLLFSACMTILISLPGGWIALAIALLYDLFYGFSNIGWTWLAIFAALLVLGEIVESLLGMVYVAKKGATRYGMLGALLGGFLGAIAGSGAMPIIGTVIGSFLGSFAGAVAGEYYRDQNMEPSVRIGLHATIGKMMATAVKFSLALAGAILVARVAVPG